MTPMTSTRTATSRSQLGQSPHEEGDADLKRRQGVEAGLTAAMLLVREACGVRDTSRRAALDGAWAERHPLPTPKERANPVEKLGTKKGCACKTKDAVTANVAAPPKPVEDARPVDAVTGRTYDRMPRQTGESVYTYARRLVTEANTRIGEGHHRVAEELLVEAGRVAAKLSSSKAMRVHHYADQIRERLQSMSRAELLLDASKDEALIDAFRDAVRSALPA